MLYDSIDRGAGFSLRAIFRNLFLRRATVTRRDVAGLDDHLLRDIGLDHLITRVANDDLTRAA